MSSRSAGKSDSPAESPETGRAQHGPRSEVNWEGGSGRQPYANQGPEETTESDNHDVAEGNRGESSGRNIEQLDEARRKP
jgi:hypothetical protein